MSQINGWLEGVIPLDLILFLWGLLAGVVAVVIYALISPQKRIKKLKEGISQSQKGMWDVDMEFSEFMRRSRENMKQSFKLLGISVLPALASALPVLFLVSWFSRSYDNWMIPFFPGVLVGSLTIKIAFRVK